PAAPVSAAVVAQAQDAGSAQPAGAVPARVADDRGQRRHPGRLILAIEDDARFAEALVALAHELDFDCVVATTAEEGLALAAEHRTSGILLDIGLPDVSGLGGLGRRQRDPRTRHTPVHAVSALARSQRAMELSAVGYLIN